MIFAKNTSSNMRVISNKFNYNCKGEKYGRRNGKNGS